MTRRNWHWDIHLPEAKIRGILAREDDPRFPRIAGALVSRIDDPKEVFKLITPLAFCRRWRVIEQAITSDAWTREKTAFWKATYLRLSKELREKGEKIRQAETISMDPFDKELIAKIRACREQALMTQQELAGFMGCNQQFISNIEKGRQKPNLDFLKKLSRVTKGSLQVTFNP